MSELVVTVPASLGGVRVDRAVALLADLPRAAVDTLVSEGRVALDGAVVRRRSLVVRPGQELRVERDEAREAALEPDPSVVFTVVHADDDVFVVDKPAGLVVHPGAGHPRGTLVNGLLARDAGLGALAEATGTDPKRPGIVHRLDRGTSGLLVVARSPRAYHSLVAQLQARSIRRRYVALVHGSVEGASGVVEAPIGRSPTAPTKMAVTRSGRPAVTRYRVERRLASPFESTLLSVELETGRTHQIRVHLAAIGNPVVGDELYGRSEPPGRPFLHAAELSFDHPGSGKRVTWSSELPEDLAGMLEGFRD